MGAVNMQIGIEAIGFYSPHYYFDLAELAKVRDIDVEKFYTGLGQHNMAMPAPGEDIVTMGANAAAEVVTDVNREAIDMVIFATESGIDCSKAAGTYVHKLLNLSNHCRVFELKQACYGATAALQLALAMIQRSPASKILVIAADVARYGLETAAESSQGAGAIAMIVSAQPKMVAIEPESGFYAEEAMDFWRPNYSCVAFVDGRFSCDMYLRLLEKCWSAYQELSGRDYLAHEYFCYHMPVPKLVERAHKRLAKINKQLGLGPEVLQEKVESSLIYGREVGNCYTAALYICLLSLLENNRADLSGKRIGFYSYGSGCVAEYFSGVVQATYREKLDTKKRQNMLNSRRALTYAEYEEFYHFCLPTDGGSLELPNYQTGNYRLVKVENHKRIYEQIND